MNTQELDRSEQRLRRGRLGLPDVVAQSVAVIAPALSGGIISYIAATKSGGATPLAYLLAMGGTLCIGGVVAEFGRHLPSAGSIYTYTTAGLSRTAGFVVGWTYSLTAMILGAATLTGFGYFASLLVQSLTAEQPGRPVAIAWYWFFLTGLVVLALMSLFDVRMTTRAQLLLTAASMTIMVVAAVVVIAWGSPAGTANPGVHLDLAAFWPAAAGIPWSGIAFGLAFGILSFAGFETGAVLAEETSDPRRCIPRAVIGAVLTSGIFYLLVTYATSIGFGVREAAQAWPHAAAGLVAVTPYPWLGTLVLFAVGTACLFCALGLHTVVSRTVFAMGREGVLPSAFGSTHRRWRTPATAIIVNLTLIAAVVFGCVALLSPGTQTAVAALPPEALDQNTSGLATFDYLATLGTPAVMFCYLLLGLAGLREGRRTSKPRFAILGTAAALTGATALYGSLYYSFVDGAIFVIRLIPAFVLVLVGSGLVLAAALRASRPRAWETMGHVFEE